MGHDIEMVLKRRLENLKDDLRSDDLATSQAVCEEAGEILDWLSPPLPPLAADAKLQAARLVLEEKGLSTEERRAVALRALRSTGRPRGRPRSETSQHAIQALSLRSATAMSWREIALKLKGCNHTRPKPERSCVPCGEAIRASEESAHSLLANPLRARCGYRKRLAYCRARAEAAGSNLLFDGRLDYSPHPGILNRSNSSLFSVLETMNSENGLLVGPPGLEPGTKAL